MRQYVDELMSDEADYEGEVGRKPRQEVQGDISFMPGAGSPGHGFVTDDPPGTKVSVVDGRSITPDEQRNSENAVQNKELEAVATKAAEIQKGSTQPVAPAVNSPVATNTTPAAATGQPATLAPATQDADPNVATISDIGPSDGMKTAPSATGTPAQSATTPVASTQATATADGHPVPEKKSRFWNWSEDGSFSSNNQSGQAITRMQELGYNPNISTLRKAVAGVEEYKRTGKTMEMDGSGPFVKGWKAEDYNNLIDWNKVGLGGIDVSKPEDRKKIQDWLYMNFGEGLKSMHIDDKFGPFHIAAILEAAGQGGENTPGNPGNPEIPEPKRPEDPKEPEPDPYRDKYEYYVRQGLNPLLAYIGDEPKAVDTSRLRAIMGAQALGEGLRSIADIVHGPNGAPITKHENNVTDWSIGKVDEALKQFHSDKKEHRKMKLDALMVAMNNARSQSNMDRQDWRNSVAQMYDRFDKKVDRQDKQWKDLITRFDDRTDKNRDFRFKVNELAAKLEDSRLTRRQAKEISIMTIASQEKMQNNTIAAQREMNKENIEAGKYLNRSTTGGTTSSVHYTYENITKLPANQKTTIRLAGGDSREVPLTMADDIVSQAKALTMDRSIDGKQRAYYKRIVDAYDGKVIKDSDRAAIIRMNIGGFYDQTGTGFVPKNGAAPAPISLADEVESDQPASTPSTGNDRPLYTRKK